MAHVSFPFKKTNKTVFQKPASILSKDAVYWKKLGSPVLVKEFGAIDYLDFSSVEPYYFAATCAVRVQVYDPITKTVSKNISQFAKAAYGGTFRSDGKLLVAGSEEAVVKLFDVNSKNLLRLFTGHSGPVHRAYFTKDQVKVLSFSDDRSVSMWDIGVEQKLASFTEHADYVRAGAPSPVTPDLFMSGSYDKTVKLYDSRMEKPVLSVNHESPVESTIFLPSGGLFVSAGGTEIKVWDILNGGKLLSCISQHHKTVTSLCLASNNSRLMSASLDRHVKVYDINTFNVVHNMDYPNAILSMAISQNDEILTVGMIDGVISIKKRHQSNKIKTQKAQGFYKFAPDNAQTQHKYVDQVVKSKKTKVGPDYEKDLKKMDFAKALTKVLQSSAPRNNPEVAASIIQELLRRNVLHIAYEGLEEKEINLLLKYFKKHLGETRFTSTIIDALNVFLDIFEDNINSFSDHTLILYKTLQKNIKNEIEVCKKVCEIEGVISMLLAGAQANINTQVRQTDIAPSSAAEQGFVVDL